MPLSNHRADGWRWRRVEILENTSLKKLSEHTATWRDRRPSEISRRSVEIQTKSSGDRRRWKVGFCFSSTERTSSTVVSKSSFFWSIKCTQPNTCLLPWIANLSGVASPWSLPNTSVVSFTIRRRSWRRSHENKEKTTQHKKREKKRKDLWSEVLSL